MVILIIHNYYQQQGGEDAGVRQERDLLGQHGHTIIEYVRHSGEIRLNGILSRIRLGTAAHWSNRTYRELRLLLATERPDVVHIHNTVPLISPSAYYACVEARVPIVQTLHNFRLLCPAGTFLRQGSVCEECVEHTLLRSIVHRCYKHSASASATIASVIAAQRAFGTWTNKVDCYIARTAFARDKFIEGGFPAERIVVKPCFVDPDPGRRAGPGDAVLFVGRLSPEKGLRTLIQSWGKLGGRIPLRVAGDGPLRAELVSEIRHRSIAGIEMLGRLSSSEISFEMKRARFLIFPSEWYEGLPLTIVEAFACGLPVVASRLGSMTDLIAEGITGLHFEPADSEDLVSKVEWAWSHPEVMEEMGLHARAEYEAKYTADHNYRLLMDINLRVTRSGSTTIS